MKYILLMYHTEGVFTKEELPGEMKYSVGLCEELLAKGQFVGASPLQEIRTATSLTAKSGRTEVRDGPFAETKEQLGGYVIVDVPNLDEAIAIAERFPAAKRGTVEIRPLFPLEGIPVVK
ncbi:YciI family protein [Bremerella sp. T1]|uniref:YciI family protein n=1 Tax=Bremerella sp. TYQ1 TaxID=3119568 RepID=UPI001CC98CD1|nr:YciI family protein [Bremerella volcania]UBM34268.1 YciI family protein [Bremerella volcania]